MERIRIDVYKINSQICIVAVEGETVLETRVRTERKSLGKVLGNRAKRRILIEASTESEWVARLLEGLGHEVIVADPNFAPMYATRNRNVKTDRRDARALAEACRLGAYRPAHRGSDKQRRDRTALTVREALVRTRTRLISVVRSLLRREGIGVGTQLGGEAESGADHQERQCPGAVAAGGGRVDDLALEGSTDPDSGALGATDCHPAARGRQEF